MTDAFTLAVRIRRRAVLVAVAAVMLTLAALPHPAGAATHAPCAGHPVGDPAVLLVGDDGTSTLSGGGGITGCPAPAGTESVTITVCLRLLGAGGVWADQACWGPHTKSWSRYWRYARQDSGAAQATCVVGWWDVAVYGGDGYAPYEWAGTPVYFTLGDSGVCGSYGGGD